MGCLKGSEKWIIGMRKGHGLPFGGYVSSRMESFMVSLFCFVEMVSGLEHIIMVKKRDFSGGITFTEQFNNKSCSKSIKRTKEYMCIKMETFSTGISRMNEV